MGETLRGKLPAKSRPQYITWVRQLSKTELHTATTAFHRARGHFQGLTIDHFRHALLHEAFVAIPEYLVQRLFREWNASGSGETSYAEFIAGIAVSAKGSRNDLLGMVFRMLSPSGDDKIVSMSDMLRFFEYVATRSGCIAIEKGKTLAAARSWTIDELQQFLFGKSVAGTLTLEKFLALFAPSGSFKVFHFLDWITNLGTRILKTNSVVLPTARILSDFSFFTLRNNISSNKRDKLRVELRSILFDLSVNSATLSLGFIIDRFRNVLTDNSLVSVVIDAWDSTNNLPDSMKREVSPSTDAARDELKLFVLGLCCVHATSVNHVYRLLFELFDEYSCGQIDVEQLSAFLQLTTGRRPIGSEREAICTIRRRGLSQYSMSSPPPSPGGSPTGNITSSQVLTLSQFIEVAQEQPGFSAAEVETALLLFRLKRCNFQRQWPASNMSLIQWLSSNFSEQHSKSNAFCLLGTNAWHQMIEKVSESQPNMTAHSNAQILYEEATELPSGQVIMPLPVWLLVAFWLGKNSNTALPQNPVQYSDNWASNIQLRHGRQNFLNRFWIRVSMSLKSCNGLEIIAIFPQVIIFEACTIQNVIDAILFQNNWCGYGDDANFKTTAMHQCQVLVAERNGAGEIKTVILQDDPTNLPQDQLAAPLGSIISSACTSWYLEGIKNYGKLAFELRVSVVDVKQEREGEGQKSENLVLSPDTANAIEQHGLQATLRTGIEVPRGLTNLGNTCFMNSVLQCLAATPMLKSHIIEKQQCDHLSSTAFRTTPVQPVKKLLPEVLQELFIEMIRVKQAGTDASTGISPNDLFNSFAVLSPHLSDGNQQDAQEFLACLLSHLSNTTKRDPSQNDESMILSPRNHAWLKNLFERKDNGTHGNIALPFCAEDSNGRHDRLVATEWWVSHLVNEPSLVNILFSGQFKSVLVCDQCTHQSARFEPFSSLQLPLEECTTDLQTTSLQDFVVIVHCAESSKNETHGSIRVVIQANEYATVADVLAKLPILRTQTSSRRYVVGNLDGCTIQNLLITERVDDQDQLEETTPASALSKPMHAFEVLNITSREDNTAAPTAGSTRLYLRFVHRQTFLVPFYCTTPTRQALCGSPFAGSSTLGTLTGQTLYRMVCQRFLLGRSMKFRAGVDVSKLQTERSIHHYSPPFALRRVREDGIACSRCHWSTGCCGCQILPTSTAAELLDLKNGETIAIDWDLQLHPQHQSAFWFLQSYPMRDHSSYIHYRRTRTHPLQQSFLSLCNIEHLDASCSHCQQESSPHTKQLSLWSLPPILVLQLERFELSTINGRYQWKKLSHNVDFPIHCLDLRDFLAPIEVAHNDSQSCTDHCSVDTMDPRVHRGIDFSLNELKILLNSASRTCTKYDLYAVVRDTTRHNFVIPMKITGGTLTIPL